MALQKEHGAETQINIFLLADAVFCALPNQKTPDGFYNIARMLRSVLNKRGAVKACGGCAKARGIDELPFVEGVEMSNMKEFARWTVEADKVLSF